MLEWLHFGELESPDHLVKMGRVQDGEGGGVMRMSTTVDASVEECAAWEMAKTSRDNASKNSRSLARSLTKLNELNSLFHLILDFQVLEYHRESS